MGEVNKERNAMLEWTEGIDRKLGKQCFFQPFQKLFSQEPRCKFVSALSSNNSPPAHVTVYTDLPSI